ncbi:MAG: protein-L-isoaspartate O-methyltransferase [Gemmobacter sp.]
MPDFADRRVTMVDTQVRPSDVTKFPVIAAMLAVPRERHVPPALREAAYVGENLPLAPGRVVLEPRSLGKMLDALDIAPDDRVLDLGTGLGYSAAVIAEMAGSVVAVEAGLAEQARAALADVRNVTVIEAPLTEGAPAEGPYDVIAVQGGVEQVPQALLDQLAEGGRIACLFMEGALGTCRIGTRVAGTVSWRDAFNAAAPVLPGFERAREFAL